MTTLIVVKLIQILSGLNNSYLLNSDFNSNENYSSLLFREFYLFHPKDISCKPLVGYPITGIWFCLSGPDIFCSCGKRINRNSHDPNKPPSFFPSSVSHIVSWKWDRFFFEQNDIVLLSRSRMKISFYMEGPVFLNLPQVIQSSNFSNGNIYHKCPFFISQVNKLCCHLKLKSVLSFTLIDRSFHCCPSV